MGISGLLPALKSIQQCRDLSDYAGKTIAVDAYVWLHKGVYSCAPDIALGKPTTKYVEYAMRNVRMLQHHDIKPLIVFDGGKLPAKDGTDSGRQKRREENLARGKQLNAQGKQTQARDCFVKCVDVTPQMAYQLIKALRAEGIQYIVAPYEADAQLAYLERHEIVDAIMTEDSDLLVFGCKEVLVKFDPDGRKVISISRSNFGNITAAPSDSSGIVLRGWNDEQFRHMAMLSGCDYLPSIPGIGLKTAWSLLRKWKTPEGVVKALLMEGKKKVPQNYLVKFQMAEKCFLHQRVWCPLQKQLVHLTDVDEDEWTEELDAYVGMDLDEATAEGIAMGNIDPTTRAYIIDINPSYAPGERPKSSPAKLSAKVKGKMRETTSTSTSNGILSFFGPNPVIPPRAKVKATMVDVMKPVDMSKSKPPHGTPNLAGKASGKRTLAEVMDQDTAAKNIKKHRRSLSPGKPTSSKFFSSNGNGRPQSASAARRHSEGYALSGPSTRADKENAGVADGDEFPSDNDDPSEVSHRAQDAESSRGGDKADDDGEGGIQQEDGYISPADSSDDVQNFSSPIHPQRRQGSVEHDHDDDMLSDDERDLAVDPISSPASARKRRPNIFQSSHHRLNTPTRQGPWKQSKTRISSATTKALCAITTEAPLPPKLHFEELDLRTCLMVDKDETVFNLPTSSRRRASQTFAPSFPASSSPPDPSPQTPKDPIVVQPVIIEIDDFGSDSELEEIDDPSALVSARTRSVAEAWRKKFTLASQDCKKRPLATAKPAGSTSSKGLSLKRSETNVTPTGRFAMGMKKAVFKSVPVKSKPAAPRRSEPFHNGSLTLVDDSDGDIEEVVDEDDVERIRQAQLRLAQYRLPPTVPRRQAGL